MKINFDQLSSGLKASLYTTSTTLPFSQNNLGNSKTSQQKFHQYSFTGKKDQLETIQFFTNSNNKAVPNSSTNKKKEIKQNDLIKSRKVPKKFSNVKTIEQMKKFIEAMDKAEQKDQPKYFKQKNKNSNKNQRTLLQKYLIKTDQEKEQKSLVQQLADRLYYQSQRRKTNATDACCKRKQCKMNIPTSRRHQIMNEEQFTGQPKRQHPASHRFSLNVNRSLQVSLEKQADLSISTRSKQRNEVHQRLYEDAKQRQEKNQKLKKQIQLKSKSHLEETFSAFKNTKYCEKYDKNYRSFFDRLQELVQWQHKKHDIYQRLNLSNSFSKLNFIKNKQKSEQHKRTPQQQQNKMVILSTRNLKCSKTKCQQENQQIFNELNKSREKLDLNKKSVMIVENHEKNILEQIKRLFYNKKTGKIKINSDKVSQLSNFQFDTFFKLIIQIEADSGHLKSEKKLQKLISDFYKNLDCGQKQQLRRLHILKSRKRPKTQRREQNLNDNKNEAILIQNSKSPRVNKKINFVQHLQGKDYWKDLIDFV